MDINIILVQTLNGLSFGIVLFLLAVGFSLVFGLAGILNMAHGSFYLLGAFIAFSLISNKFSFIFAILVSGAVTGVLGIVLERLTLRFLYKQLLSQALLTFGFMFIFIDIMKSIWGGHPKMIQIPNILSGTISIGLLQYPIYRLFLLLVGLVMAIGLWFCLYKTRIGSIIRAGIDDKDMVMAMGINLNFYVTLVFFIGSSLAGIAGVLGGPLLGAHLGLDMDVLILAMIVVIIGGLGSFEGAFIGAIMIGLVDTFGKVFIPKFAMFTVFFSLVLILLFKPSGILGKLE